MSNPEEKIKLVIELEKGTYEFVRDLRYVFGGARYGKTVQSNVINAIKFAKPYIKPSGDLISREDLLKCPHGGDWNGGGFSKEYVLVDEIKSAPPAEAYTLEDMQNNYDAGAESEAGKHDRATGVWEDHSTYDGVIICSNCGTGGNRFHKDFNYCPICGAYMKGSAQEEDE